MLVDLRRHAARSTTPARIVQAPATTFRPLAKLEIGIPEAKRL